MIYPIVDRSLGTPLVLPACALTPGLAWSPNGDKIAFRDEEGKGRLLDLSALPPVACAEFAMGNLGLATAMAFAPDGDRIVTLSKSLPGKMTLTLVRPGHKAEWECVLAGNRMSGHRSEGVNLAWSPDGKRLACTTGTATVWLIDAATGQQIGQFDNHSLIVTGLDWMDDERIVSASEDATLQLWHPDGPASSIVVETIPAAGMVFVRERGTALIWSAKGELFVWSLIDSPVQLWYRDPPSRSVAAHFTRLAISAGEELLALVDAGGTDLAFVRDWHQTASAPANTTTYANAKVLLLGDSGVGKSGLAMVIAGEEFRPTESTHARRIFQLPTTEYLDTADGEREILLWDLAGQPHYRIVHQLHLGGAALALILFDSSNETGPLVGVRHWARAVRHAHPAADGGLTAFLVAARVDRGGVALSSERVQEVIRDFKLDGWFKTSARDGTGVDDLRSKILAAIDWERIPKITSTALFAAVKKFVVERKTSGTLLARLDDLCRDFQATVPDALDLLNSELQIPDPADVEALEGSAAGLTAVFEGCVARLESAGLVKRLKFLDYILLRPELLDAYASAVVHAARDEPDGLGSIMESKVIDMDIPLPAEQRVEPERLERLLVFATLEELIQHELVLKEATEDGMLLVFPSAYRRDLPSSQAPKGDGVVFGFEGPVANVYATLIVRLTRSNAFERIGTWQSAARFAAEAGECTIFLKSDGEGKAELRIGYEGVPPVLRMQFERFVHTHLERRATTGTVTRERQYSCPGDKTAFTSEQVQQVRQRGRDTILCPVCEERVSLRDDYESAAGADQVTADMDASADRGRESAVASTVLRGKEEVEGFDVFLCHNVADKPAVRDLARRLQERGIRPWLDEWELRPGIPWQRALERQIQSIPAAIVIVGSEMGPWQNHELEAFIRQFVRRGCPVIPVLLPGVACPDMPVFLDGLTWIDLEGKDSDPFDQLEWGITGRHPEK